MQLSDINPYSASSNIRFLDRVGGAVLMVATRSSAGAELWRSDGTTAGTWLVKDIRPGPESSFGPYNTGPRARNGNTLYFIADDGVHGTELWRSDGTPVGTTLVIDQTPGSTGTTFGEMVAFGSGLLFQCSTSATGLELFFSDGTVAGTRLVKDISPGATSSNQSALVAFGGAVYFSAKEFVNGIELWRTDGTEAGTVLVKNVRPSWQSSEPQGLTVSGGQLFFLADDGTNGRELWVTDGTEAGTHVTKVLAVGQYGDGDPAYFQAFKNGLFFSVNDGTGREPWFSDGTAPGTYRIADIDPTGSGFVQNAVVVGDRVYFNGHRDDIGNETFVTDGTVAGTGPCGDFQPGTGDSSGLVYAIGSQAWLTDGDRFYRLNGSVGGAIEVMLGANLVDLFAVGNGAALAVATSSGSGDHDLWRSDGTPAGTVPVADTNPGNGDSDPQALVALGGVVLFNAVFRGSSSTLCSTNGTSSGTYPRGGIDYPYTGPLSPSPPVVMGTYAYFGGNNSSYGNGLWRMAASGSPEIVRNFGSSAGVGTGAALGTTLFFSAESELWKSDGTYSGTVLVKDINASYGSSPRSFTVAGGKMYFVAQKDMYMENQLFTTNGTSAGTIELKAGAFGLSSIADLTPVGTSLWCVAAASGCQLWKSDGTVATTSAFDTFPVLFSELEDRPRYLTVLGTSPVKVLLAAKSATSGTELWVSDGTTPGTVPLKDIFTGSASSRPRDLVKLGTSVVFSADDGVHGRELWISNGTALGTTLLSDIAPGAVGSDPRGLTVSGGRVYFTANDQVQGREIWVTDGTLAGTVLHCSTSPGPGTIQPTGLFATPSAIYFAGRTDQRGNELWAVAPVGGTALAPGLDPGPLPQPPVEGDPNPGTPHSGWAGFGSGSGPSTGVTGTAGGGGSGGGCGMGSGLAAAFMASMAFAVRRRRPSQP